MSCLAGFYTLPGISAFRKVNNHNPAPALDAVSAPCLKCFKTAGYIFYLISGYLDKPIIICKNFYGIVLAF